MVSPLPAPTLSAFQVIVCPVFFVNSAANIRLSYGAVPPRDATVYAGNRGVRELLSCSHFFPIPIESFPFPFPAATIYTTLKPRNMHIVSWIQKIWSYSRSIANQTHHSSVIIIITITAYQCSLFNVYQTVTACYDELDENFIFSAIKYAIPIPIRNIPISIPIPIIAQNYSHSHENLWESTHGNGNSHSHAHGNSHSHAHL